MEEIKEKEYCFGKSESSTRKRSGRIGRKRVIVLEKKRICIE